MYLELIAFLALHSSQVNQCDSKLSIYNTIKQVIFRRNCGRKFLYYWLIFLTCILIPLGNLSAFSGKTWTYNYIFIWSSSLQKISWLTVVFISFRKMSSWACCRDFSNQITKYSNISGSYKGGKQFDYIYNCVFWNICNGRWLSKLFNLCLIPLSFWTIKYV